MNAPCPDCTAPLQPLGPAPQAEHGTVAGAADDPVRWSCRHEHGPFHLAPDVAVAQVLDGIDVAERTKVRGRLRCGACRTPYAMPGRRATRSVTVTDPDGLLAAARLTFDVPVLRCTEDAVESIPPECVADLTAVVRTLVTGGGADEDDGADA